ncbi:MAG: histidine phosphatase family protein [Lentisphaeria bacterium]|nr:histidine phosphatase family protein [Lentisphaeria bacterium]
MVKTCLFFLVLAGSVLFAAEPDGKVWLIRHGQRCPVLAPDFDPPLTAEGRKQAQFAAGYLKKMGFRGKIYASPYRRTLETASIIAETLDLPIMIAPFLQEFVRFPGVHPVRERPIAELKKEFPRLVSSPELLLNWAIRSRETLDSVRDRFRAGLDELSLSGGREVLLVTHGAVLKAAHMLATGCGASGPWKKMNWNCCLSMYEFSPGAPPRVRLFFEVGFLPEESITSNDRKKTAKKTP